MRLKRNVLRVQVVEALYSAVFLSVVLALNVVCPTNAIAANRYHGDARAERVERVLIPPVLVRGQPIRGSRLVDRMAALHVPGVSIAVIRRGAIEWARGYGVTHMGGDPITPDTIFQVASISKPVSAMAALMLVDVGRVNLDSDVNEYLLSWKVPANALTKTHPVTLRELLSHTAGVTVHGFSGYTRGVLLPPLTAILNGVPPANSAPITVDTVPGSASRYSGGGYMIVQQLLEDMSGTPFAITLKNDVLDRIGMRDSTFSQPLPVDKLRNAARPHDSHGNEVSCGPHTYPEMAAAGLWSSASDLAKFVIEVQRSLKGQANDVLSVDMTKEMLTANRYHQGLGAHVEGIGNALYFEQDGSNAGYRSELFAYAAGDGAVILTNGDNGYVLNNELLRTLAREYGWPKFQPAIRAIDVVNPNASKAIVGSYRFPSGETMSVRFDRKHLFAQQIGQEPHEIFPEAPRQYFYKDTQGELLFEKYAGGHPSALRFRDDPKNVAARLDDLSANSIAVYLKDVRNRFAKQISAKTSEDAIRALITGLEAGKPVFDNMTDNFASKVRQTQNDLQVLLNSLGSLKSVEFKSVSRGGSDVYEVSFANGNTEFQVTLQEQGKILSAGFRLLAGSERSKCENAQSD
jgi:CubicO group peptidase (beta-lactamase class C family)